MKQLRALDFFCGDGGASMGLHRAGFDVVGIDIKPRPRYPFEFVQADALHPPFDIRAFDFIWASPPCQAHTSIRHVNGRNYDCLIDDSRAMLQASGLPYVIENVPAAPLSRSAMLCGTMFGLGVGDAELRRHRIFEANFDIPQIACCHGRRRVISIHGDTPRDARQRHLDRAKTITVTGSTAQQNVVRNVLRSTFSVDDARHAMGINWMTMKGLSQAIPPAYSEFIGRAAIRAIMRRAAA